MRHRPTLPALVFLLASFGHSFADLRIISAYFGRPEQNQDVKRTVKNFVENGVFAFRISGENLGAKQHRDQKDYLRVVYEVDGRRCTTDGVEGQVFTFEGVRDPIPSGFLGLPGRAPWAETAPIQITNSTNSQLTVSSAVSLRM